jgi:hypothetical protein
VEEIYPVEDEIYLIWWKRSSAMVDETWLMLWRRSSSVVERLADFVEEI